MRRLVVLAAASVAAFSGLVPVLTPVAEAQSLRRRGEERIILNVRPRSYLDAGNVVAVGTEDRFATGFGQTASYLNLPPWHNMRERFGESSLPDPITNGPFVGASNPFGPIDYVAPRGLAR
jgi:hypothetical protein